MDKLPTVPDDPPAAGPDRALDPPPPEPLLAAGEALLAAGEALLAAVEALLEAQPATAMAAAPATMDMVSLREGIG